MASSANLVHEIPTSALAVYGHPDDPEISAGGTLARWARGGATVWELICTRGEKGSQDPNQDRDALALDGALGRLAAALEGTGG